MNKIFYLFLLLILLTTGVYADSNGLWTKAEDVEGGTFGSDENIKNFRFIGDSLDIDSTNLRISSSTSFNGAVSIGGATSMKDLIIDEKLIVNGGSDAITLNSPVGKHTFIKFTQNSKNAWVGFQSDGDENFVIANEVNNRILLNGNVDVRNILTTNGQINVKQGINVEGSIINMNMNKISKVGSPVDGYDVANKKYVDYLDALDLDKSSTNEIQNLGLSGNSLSITSGTGVDLSKYLDNTDKQSLSISGHTLSLTNGGSVTLPDNVNDADFIVGNEYPMSGDGISVNGGRIVSLNTPNAADLIRDYWLAKPCTNPGEYNPYTNKVCNGGETVYEYDEYNYPSCPSGYSQSDYDKYCVAWNEQCEPDQLCKSFELKGSNNYENKNYNEVSLDAPNYNVAEFLIIDDLPDDLGTCETWKYTSKCTKSATWETPKLYSWTEGNYCILQRKSYNCPTGFTSSKVHFDLEDSKTTSMGNPGGFFTQDGNGNIEMYMCCK